ncbi:MAG TPA: hypothetical protein VFI11_09930 [Anaerolineales bacterium]|nr:hypothetical protein [Anaerolineales bacterium]
MSGLKSQVPSAGARCVLQLEHGLRFLTPKEINVIDDLLASVAPFGEVRLAVQKGKLRFVSSVKSHDAFQLTGKNEKTEP